MHVPRVNVSVSTKTIKHKVKQIRSELKSTAVYYKNNAQNGWQTGKRLSKINRYGKTKSFLTGISSSIAKTKIRKQDIAPVTCACIGATSFIPGGTMMGFQFGKLINKIFKIAK